ncbi:hypothetical protein Nepgr_021367 [Nepenthes gracilis]|uniref:VQ domain-containing protein n=1 Tax=Nepenthes gracilis TaxID=150966 RepID=A0AAD3SYX1_NEPGR|nr:hypothetical protein Nepgr_021367 [Nepenthes gracilis]
METSTKAQDGSNTELQHQYCHQRPHAPPSPAGAFKQQQEEQRHGQIEITRSETNNPYPTTFVQADTSSFKHVVQMLTGSSETTKQVAQARPTNSPVQPPPGSRNPIPPVKTCSKTKPSRLYERRNNQLKNLGISPLFPGLGSNGGNSPRNAEILSPSLLDFPALVLSPVTPLITDPFNRSPISKSEAQNIAVDTAAEEKAIAEKGFYLHPSPVSTPRQSEPRLLPLFPITSPRLSGSNSS